MSLEHRREARRRAGAWRRRRMTDVAKTRIEDISGRARQPAPPGDVGHGLDTVGQRKAAVTRIDDGHAIEW